VTDSYDVVIVGGGIAGGALAGRLAGAGLRVLLLEQQEHYRDKVRGETIAPWGVREVLELGLEQVLLDAGGKYVERLFSYDETVTPAEAEETALPYALVAPDVAGTLNVGHPEASEALAAHAAALGAQVLRGVREVKLSPGATPTVAWSNGTGPQEAGCRLVVGADGRGSAVRRQIGIQLEERPAATYGAGLLVQAETGFDGNTMGTANEALFFAFPRRDGYARLYLLVDPERQRQFTGPGRLESFLGAYANQAFPASPEFAAGRAAGPCGGAPMTDSWTIGPPGAEGAVLVGDAAGWNDPIIGQGLSIALRDARSVADVITGTDDWSAGAFGDYVDERRERMRRLAICAHIHTAMRCRHDDEWRSRRRRWRASLPSDPTVMMQAACSLAGPETAPAEVFTDAAVERVLAM
jgi:2-polyprenyl-6-methoxyphenol hydroxylase-like FAD-dependent oxidoreductase